MDCKRCGRKLERGWNFCPFCGFRPESRPQMFGGAFGGILDRMMKRLSKQMEDLDRQTSGMERNFEVMDLSPMFRDLDKQMRITGKPNARGFTIRINRTNDNEPKIDVKTFGNMDEAMQKQVREQLSRMGIRQPTRPVKLVRPARPAATPIRPAKPAGPATPGERHRPTAQKPKRKEFPAPKVCEEPKTSVRRIDSKVFVDMEIPGVKDEQDIEINELESSVEVRAMAGDKAYFKILTLPSQFSLSKKEFSKGKLHLEFA